MAWNVTHWLISTQVTNGDNLYHVDFFRRHLDAMHDPTVVATAVDFYCHHVKKFTEVAYRIGQIDLMNIADPDGKARIETDGGEAGRFSLPFFTIEDVMRVDETHIMVAVDNNLPFSSGRKLDAAADNEVVLLSVPELLAAQ